VENDPRGTNSRVFQTAMCDSCCADPLCFCGAILCAPCGQFYLRRKVLGDDLTRYVCCQGYYDRCCFKAGNCCEHDCPTLCLCIESCLCISCAMSATRNYAMDAKGLQSDPCDRRIIRFNNCVQLCSCVCSCIAALTGQCQEGARILDTFAHIVFYIVLGCMAAQVNVECNFDRKNGGPLAPTRQTMK